MVVKSRRVSRREQEFSSTEQDIEKPVFADTGALWIRGKISYDKRSFKHK